MTQSQTHHRPVVLITGGSGFLGHALIQELSKPAGQAVFRPAEIRVLDKRPPSWPGGQEGIVFTPGDVCLRPDVARACAGADLVIHLAALIDWGQHPAGQARAVNVGGTRNVIDACLEAGVRSLVSVSSLDAIYPGRPVCDANESFPYPTRFANEYCASKAEAEQAVLEANGKPCAQGDGGAARLRTIVLRPCSIWGAGDPYHVGSFLKLARLGPVIRLGRNRSPYQFVYVGNIAHALVLAAKALLDGREESAGQVYFIKDFPARNIFDLLEPIIRAAGGSVLPPSLALPRRPVKALATLLTFAARCLQPIYRITPLLTPFSVDSVCNQFTVETDKAARLLDYRPIYSEAEAYARTIAAVAQKPGQAR